MDSIIGVCLNEQSKNPVEIIEKMMEMPFCHMHEPEHHVMVGAALLTAYHNAGGEVDLNQALPERKGSSRRRLWILGCLRSWYQYRNVHVCYHKGYTAGCKGLGIM